MSFLARFAGRRKHRALMETARRERLRDELHEDLPDLDLEDDPGEWLVMYPRGSRPQDEEEEHLTLLEEAVDRMTRGR